MTLPIPYSPYFEDNLQGRYVAFQHIKPLLDLYEDIFEISKIGASVKDCDIHCVKIGHGDKKVLGWSQMHGNESTTTKALFDLFKFINDPGPFQNKVNSLMETYTLFIIPMLNPDGAAKYTRENASEVDLNRDAVDLSQPESRALRTIFDKINPDLCLNLHGQRTKYSLPGRECATLSFLSPAANEARDLTPARIVAMKEIVKIARTLENVIPGKIGRYDDSFNPNCVGDAFQMAGATSILFEAGHYPDDYGRNKAREATFYAFLSLFGCLEGQLPESHEVYFEIPENQDYFKDVLLRNVVIGDNKLQSLSITYEEILENEHIRLEPIIDAIGDLDEFFGHEEIDVKGASILLNYYENVFENEKVTTIVDKNSINRVFFKDSCKVI